MLLLIGLLIQPSPATLFAFPSHFPKLTKPRLFAGLEVSEFNYHYKKVSMIKLSVHAIAVPLQSSIAYILTTKKILVIK